MSHNWFSYKIKDKILGRCKYNTINLISSRLNFSQRDPIKLNKSERNILEDFDLTLNSE